MPVNEKILFRSFQYLFSPKSIIYAICRPFMTQGLLISRNTKNKLHKKAMADPTPLNIQNYKRFKSIYFRTLRGAKKLHITNKLNENVGNPKKCGKLLMKSWVNQKKLSP